MVNTIITEVDNGNHFHLHVGDTVTLQLQEKSAAGYQWVPAKVDSDKVSYIKQHTSTSPQPVGSAHFCVFIFTAKAPGSSEIQLKHWRPWEGDASIIARYSFELDILK